MNRPELTYIICGALCSTMVGLVQPLFAVIFAEILVLFSEFEDDPDELLKRLGYWAGGFCAIGAINFFGNLGACAFFGKSGEELTMRLRFRVA